MPRPRSQKREIPINDLKGNIIAILKMVINKGVDPAMGVPDISFALENVYPGIVDSQVEEALQNLIDEKQVIDVHRPKCLEEPIQYVIHPEFKAENVSDHDVVLWHRCLGDNGIRKYPSLACSFCLGRGNDFDPNTESTPPPKKWSDEDEAAWQGRCKGNDKGKGKDNELSCHCCGELVAFREAGFCNHCSEPHHDSCMHPQVNVCKTCHDQDVAAAARMAKAEQSTRTTSAPPSKAENSPETKGGFPLSVAAFSTYKGRTERLERTVNQLRDQLEEVDILARHIEKSLSMTYDDLNHRLMQVESLGTPEVDSSPTAQASKITSPVDDGGPPITREWLNEIERDVKLHLPRSEWSISIPRLVQYCRDLLQSVNTGREDSRRASRKLGAIHTIVANWDESRGDTALDLAHDIEDIICNPKEPS